ncbi:hypothetical protein [Burkholderia gladioli]|uniref:hypothetical protein n=1 Tax=Burkholderia gladioli TaxID=28095 RepID=UPI00163FEF81|nr:hypothetical protein [Burkholderia gladioli]
MNIDEMLFAQPSGNVRGTVAMQVTVRGKKVRVAIATLLTEGAPSIQLSVPTRLSLNEIDDVAQGLIAFADRLRSI